MTALVSAARPARRSAWICRFAESMCALTRAKGLNPRRLRCFLTIIAAGNATMRAWSSPGGQSRASTTAAWVPVVAVESPRGEATLNSANPIVVEEEVVPREVVKLDDGYLYDFGINSAGVCRLRIQGDRGQRIILHHGEHLLEDGSLDLLNLTVPAINGADADRMQRDEYICKGGEMETYVPRFTYHGFRYVWIRGICEEQAGPDTLTFLVMHTKLRERGGFRCSDETVNTLQRLTRRSTLANFFHFPTDCPQREKKRLDSRRRPVGRAYAAQPGAGKQLPPVAAGDP